MSEGRVEIVCVNAGDKFPDYYVQRLYHMIERNFNRPFRLSCFTDRKRNISSEIEQIDISQHGETGFFNKMLLYNTKETPYDEMFFMDISLVIIDDITHLVDHAKKLDSDLVAIIDWKRPVMNSCVQWIKKNDTTDAIWDFYKSDKNPEFRTRGDQEFTFDALKTMRLEDRLGYFPEDEIQSYKILRSANRRSVEEAKDLLKRAKIIKFHGVPRATEILDPWQRFLKVSLRYPQHAFKDWNFLVEEIREWWQ